MNEAPLSKLLSNVVDNRGRTCPVVESGFPLIATNCVKSDHLYPVFEKVRFVDHETYSNWFRDHPLPGDFIFVLKGSPGEVCLTPDPVPFCIAQDMVALRADPQKIRPSYLFAFLRSQMAKNAILNMHVGTMIPHFKKGDFDKLIVPLPDEVTQEFIGDWYLTISKKIELNRRMSETLEALAQAIFKDWFVTFGPTRRKMEGATDPVAILGGLIPDPAEAVPLAALFPDSFGEDGSPEGWQELPLEKTLVLQRGFDLPKTARTDGRFPVIAASGPSGTHDKFKVKGPGICTGRSGVLGGVFYVREDFWPLNTSLWVKEYPNATPLYAFYLLKKLDLLSLNAGSAVPTLNRNHVHKLRVSTPRIAVVLEFEKLASTLYDRIGASEIENRTLAETRDYLLPKLMSGAVRVRDAAAMVE